MNQPKVGLLPLYLELYDNAMPQVRPRIDAFGQQVMSALRARGVDVLATPARRLREEFEGAVRLFEDANVDAIVTLHLAYSPSLESVDALASTGLPIIVLDTTPSFSYGPSTDPDELMYNHGIHGVQDLCNVLIRRGKPFAIEAGHWEKSDVIDRVASWARAARAAKAMRAARVGRIGQPFAGMGDFAVPPGDLHSAIGIETIACDPSDLVGLLPAEGSDEVRAEMASDLESFSVEGLDEKAHELSVRAGLAVRRWIENEKLTAVTMNFLAFTQESGFPVVPFLEASKGMARRIGYAGEGDVLTAGLVGALASVYPDTTFTEMFCPDWEGNQIYLSHMGEMNLRLADSRPVLKVMPFPWSNAQDPVFALGRFRGGKAVFVNIAPGPENTYSLIVAPVEMQEVGGEDRMSSSIHGWFRPAMPISDFLAAYSRAGGTHHAALVYGEVETEIAHFGELMGWKVVLLS